MENSYEDRYGRGDADGVEHDGYIGARGSDQDLFENEEGSASYLDTDEEGFGGSNGISASPYYLSNLDGGEASPYVAMEDDFPNVNDALGHASLFSSEAGLGIHAGIEGLEAGFMAEYLNSDVGGKDVDSKLMNLCLLHGGLEFTSTMEMNAVLDEFSAIGLIEPCGHNTYRCNVNHDNANNYSNGEENEDIIVDRKAILFPAMQCSEELLDKVMSLINSCEASYIKFIHIAEDTTIVSELVNGEEVVYHDDLESIVGFLEIDDAELQSVVELQNDDKLSIRIYDNLIAWLNTDEG